MAGEYKLIDPFTLYPPSPEDAAKNTDPNSTIRRWFKGSVLLSGATIGDAMAAMDEAGVEKALMLPWSRRNQPASASPYSVGTGVSDEDFLRGCEELAAAIKNSRGRLSGHVALDPSEPMKAVRRLEMSVRDFGFVSAWLMPVAIGLPPNHPTYFPIYAKCVELNIPIKVNIGVPAAMRRSVNARPTDLEDALLCFPELMVVGCHVGHPWHLEVVAMLQKYENFRLITSGFAPKYVPEEIWKVANTRAAHKVMWASDYPVLSMERCAREGWEVPLKDEVKRRYLRENALEVFRLG